MSDVQVSQSEAPLLKLNFLSHGTLESRDLELSRKFYEECLGLQVVRTSNISLLIKLGGDNTIAVVQSPEFNRFPNGFSHIFAGGYAAGYYSYKWAEVLAADAFSLFEEKGIFDPETGKAFLQNILEKGGSQEPMELFKAFRGREPQVDALLEQSGITGEVA